MCCKPCADGTVPHACIHAWIPCPCGNIDPIPQLGNLKGKVVWLFRDTCVPPACMASSLHSAWTPACLLATLHGLQPACRHSAWPPACMPPLFMASSLPVATLPGQGPSFPLLCFFQNAKEFASRKREPGYFFATQINQLIHYTLGY